MTPGRTAELILVGLVAMLYLLPLARVQYRIGDEGSIVYGAVRLLRGEVPYRDFFEVMSPGSFVWLAAWFAVFGKTWLSLHVALMVGWVTAVGVLHWLTLQVHTSRFRFLPAATYLFVAIPNWPGASQHWDSNTAAFLAVATYVACRHSQRAPRWIGCGILVGMVGLFSQQKGAWLLLSLILAEIIHGYLLGGMRARLRQSALLVLGAAVVGGIWVGTYIQLGALDDWFYAVVRWPLTQYGSTNRLPYGYGLREWLVPYWVGMTQALAGGIYASRLLVALATIPFLLLLSIPVVAVVVPLILARSKAGDDRSALLAAYTVIGTGLLLAEAHRPDIAHVLYGTPILLVVAVALSGRVTGRAASMLVDLTALAMACGIFIVSLINFVPSRANVTVHSRRGDYRALHRDEALEFLQSHLSAGETVFVYPYYPMYYFLADLENPTRYSVLMYGINTDSQFREAIDALERDHTRFVLWDQVVSGDHLRTWFPEYRHPDIGDQLMERYLEQKYRFVTIKEGFRILERKSE